MRDDDLLLSRRSLLVGAASGLVLLACDGGDDPDAGRADSGRADSGSGPVDSGPMDSGPGPVDSGPRPDGSAACSNLSFEMGDPHPAGFRHNLVIDLADVDAGVDKTFDIQGESRHPHTLLVTAAHFATLAAGGSVTINSSEDMGFDLHDHAVTITCGA